ncbi:ASP-1 protein [Aphelenchoides avenae]|nr:ASP-1 protein [Aphelenchus avenae]
MQLPTLIALFLSATAVFGAVFQSDLKLHKSAQARRANKSDPKGVHRGERLKSGSQPVTDFLIGNDLLLVDVSLGTPAQKFTYQVSIGGYFSNELTALGKSCQEPYELCDHPYGTTYTRSLFDPSASSTYKAVKAYDDTIISGTAGTISTDVVQIGGISTTLNFALANKVDTTIQYNPIDGVLPLGLGRTENGGSRVVDALKSQLDAPLFTIWLDKQVTTNGTKAKDGTITFGALDTTNCASSWSYSNTVVKDDWTIGASGIKVGRLEIERDIQLGIDSSYSTLSGPTTEIQSIANAIGATLGDHGGYVVDCKATLPDIVFALGGTIIRVTPAEYVTNIKTTTMFGDELCMTAIDELNCGGWFCPDWIVGTPFLRATCTAFDFDKQRVGLAPTKHSTS